VALVPQEKFEKRFGQSHAFLASTLQENVEGCRFDMLKSLDDCIHVLSCGYENKTQWGKEVTLPRPVIFSLFHVIFVSDYCSCVRNLEIK
jgi:hypothetical protein